MDARALGPAVLVMLAMLGAHAGARAQEVAPSMRWDVPCGEPWAFVASVGDLGGSFVGFDVEVEVGATDTGAFLGHLSIGRAGQLLATRSLEDAACADVVDALVIAAALALRTLPAPPLAPLVDAATPPPVAAADDETAPPPDLEGALEAPASPGVRVALLASLRGGLGPTPGPVLAPTLGAAIEVERIVLALHLVYWPEAAATLADGQRGVVLWASSSTLEVGVRLGDALSIVPSVVLEPSVAVARGIGIPSPRSEVTLVLDAGASVALTFDVDRLRLFVRGDVLFGLVQPVYGVEGETVLSGPIVRGTGGAGLAVFL